MTSTHDVLKVVTVSASSSDEAADAAVAAISDQRVSVRTVVSVAEIARCRFQVTVRAHISGQPEHTH